MLDRRDFLKLGGLAAGSALMGGCGSVHINIPDLPVAQIPPVPGMTYIKASALGCALDCDLSTGRNRFTGGKATDDGPRINAAMAAATAENPITLIIDGPASISGLFMPAGGNWSIIGQGGKTGFFIRTGTNNDGIHNGDSAANVPTNPGPPAPATRGSNVTLANFVLNGNHGNGYDGDSTTGSTQGILNGQPEVWYFGINLMNLDDINVINVAVINAPSFHFRFSNCGHVTVTGSVVQSIGVSTDGLHFDGPANDISISNCQFTTGDDAIALNCPEGWSGNIENVTISNCTFNSWTLLRIDTIQSSGAPNRSLVNNVQVSGCSGQMSMAAFLLGMGADALPDSISNLTISDCTLSAPTVFEVGANFGTVVLKNVQFTPGVFALTQNQFLPPGFAIARTSTYFDGCTYQGAHLLLENVTVVRNSNVDVTPVILEYGSSIANLEVNGFAVNDKHAPLDAFVNADNGTLGQWTIDAIYGTRIAAAVKGANFAQIGVVTGTGLAVLNSGWPFADAVMANNVPYISAETGAPSIKIDGAVQPYA